MIELVLTNSDLKAQVSDNDFDLCFYTWSVMKVGYVRCNNGTAFKTRYLHQIIANRMKLKGNKIDHEDRNKFNCQRSNIRIATNSESAVNAEKHSASGYRGVRFHEPSQKWQARIRWKNNQQHLGLFEEPVDAAKAYDKAAKQLHGVFALLNFPEKSIE